jgi:subtilisin family serine protease
MKQFAIFLIMLITGVMCYGQIPKGWHLKSISEGYYGINLEKAYEFLKEKQLKGKTVVVGIVDSGIDTLHEDLLPVLWRNNKEVGGNGKDDDGNGYRDDVNGWNFLGSNDGTQNVIRDSHEVERVYWGYKNQFMGKNKADIPAKDIRLFNAWKKAEVQTLADSTEYGMFQRYLAEYKKRYLADSVLKKSLGKEQYTRKELKSFVPSTALEKESMECMLSVLPDDNDINNDAVASPRKMLAFLSQGMPYVQPAPYRDSIVNDNEDDIEDRFYGNTNLGSRAMHGTHVAGIVGAARDNGIGMDGVADNVRIMLVRAVPDGDEHDKDVALAIRYAVDNGAKVINMSFGKIYSPQKKWVDDAVRYAEKKNVLLVKSAGNDGRNIDENDHFPSPIYLDGTRARNVITVGASGANETEGLVARFSNYGVKNVDVFAPGVEIYSTVTGEEKYLPKSGTSMAAPVVTGVAALLMSYFPQLSAVQVKDIIERTVYRPATKVKTPRKRESMVLLSELCKTGGIVDAYEAVKLAAKTKPAKRG